jgi:hypothetical protein
MLDRTITDAKILAEKLQQLNGFMAILTKRTAPSGAVGARIMAEYAGKRVFVDFDFALSVEENRRKAAEKLCKKLGITPLGLIAGSTSHGFAFIVLNDTLKVLEEY